MSGGTRRSAHCPPGRARASMAGMTVADTVGAESLQEQAHRHLLMHFTRNGAFGPGRQAAARARARRGRLRVRHRRQPLLRRAVVAVLLPDRLLVRRGDGGGRVLAALHAGVQHELGDRAPAGDPARRRAGRARARRPQPRLLHQRRLGVGRGRLEDRPPALPGQGRAAAHEGDRARDRLPRRHPRRAVVHRRAAVQGAVRRRADPGRAGLQHQPRSATPTASDDAALVRAAARRDGAHDRRGRAGDRGDGDRRARPERRRLPRPARGLLAGPARAVRPLRDRAGRRRGDHRLRAHRRVVRLRRATAWRRT